MQLDARLSRMLHLLIHMDRTEGSVTSGAAATMLNTNPVVVRRTMAGLREAGLVRSEKGPSGGWTLTKPLASMTVLDVYKALGEPRVFAIGLTDPGARCLVEQAVNAALQDAMHQAEALLITRLDQVTLAEIAADFDNRLGYATPDGRC